MNIKTKIIEELTKVDRRGITALIKFLEKSDYFTAPASTHYHSAYKGGLIFHSWQVFQLLKEKNKRYELGMKEESIIVISLLHDVSKVSMYKKVNGDYVYGEDALPLTHGCKSVIMLQKYIDLTDEEILCIAFHMNAFDSKLDLLNKATDKYKSVVATFTADYEASQFLERRI